ncbi:MAG: beta-ketoacyl synthase chain length factor [Rubrivivax sp.]
MNTASATSANTAATLVLHIDGIGFWAPPLPGWAHAQAALRGERAQVAVAGITDTPQRPSPTLLAANERRRAPDSVLLALQVAHEAVTDSGHDAHDLASIFTSAYGDLPIVDALCRTLASDPLLLSPTRFHHSVHNAASGYWAIASGSRAASSAVAGGARSFACGLLEAAATAAADDTGVLLVGFDTEARGPLASVNASRGLLGVALVLAPAQGPRSRWRVSVDCVGAGGAHAAGPAHAHALALALAPAPAPAPANQDHATAVHSAWQALKANAQADALPLMQALANGKPQQLWLALSDGLQLRLQLEPIDAAEAAGPSGMMNL